MMLYSRQVDVIRTGYLAGTLTSQGSMCIGMFKLINQVQVQGFLNPMRFQPNCHLKIAKWGAGVREWAEIRITY